MRASADGAQVHHRFLKQIAAASGQDAHGSRRRRRGPIDVLPCQEAPVIERARISEIARRTHLRVEFDILPVVQRGQRLARLGVQRDLRPRVAVQFEQEAFPLARHRRRLHHAPAQNHHFASAGIDLWRRPRCVHPRIERPREEQPEQAADARQHARSAPQRQAAEDEESGNGPQGFRRSKRYEPVDQDARSKGSQGTQQWMLQLSAIVTACGNLSERAAGTFSE